jgi:hypothetical protein
VLGRLSTRAHALAQGQLYVHMPVSPNHHLTGAKYRDKRNAVSAPDASDTRSTPWAAALNSSVDTHTHVVMTVQTAAVEDEYTLEAMESFLNLGADEVDVRTIKMPFTIDGTDKNHVRCRSGVSGDDAVQSQRDERSLTLQVQPMVWSACSGMRRDSDDERRSCIGVQTGDGSVHARDA